MGGYGALPALQFPQQPSPMENLSRLMQLRQTLQNAPLQQQLLRNQAQQSQIELQNAQQTQADQQAFRKKMTDPSMRGKTIGQIADALAQEGSISPASLLSLKKADVDQRTSLANLDEKTLANAKASHEATQHLFDNVMNLPDDKVQSSWPQIAQQYNAIPGNEKSPLNPAQPMTKQQLGQYGPMLSMGTAYLDEEQSRRTKAAEEYKSTQQGNEAAANAVKTTQQLKWYTDHGLAPGVSPEEAGMADWLKKNPGKGPSDYQIAMKKIVPAFNFALQTGNTGGGASGQPTDWGKVAASVGMTPTALDQASERYWQTGQMPPIGRGTAGPALQRAIMNRAGELHPQGSLAANSAEFKANQGSLENLQKQFDSVSGFENTANKNIEVLEKTLSGIPDYGRFLNVPARMISDRMLGTEGMASFKTALATVQSESAKILNSANASGVLSDSARHELQSILDPNSSLKAIKASLGVLQQDFANRHQAYADQISDIKKRMGGSLPNGSQTGASKPLTITLPSGKSITVQ